jgi:transcriptional regulator of heat shock response
MSLDSGLDKTVILKCNNDLTEAQLRKLVRYLNDELVGLRIYDIANRVLVEMKERRKEDNDIISQFLQSCTKPSSRSATSSYTTMAASSFWSNRSLIRGRQSSAL